MSEPSQANNVSHQVGEVANKALQQGRSWFEPVFDAVGQAFSGPWSSVVRVTRKEIASFFSSLAGLIFIGTFLAAVLFTFFWVERFFARNIADVRPMFEWMPILMIFLVSALTMRMWSEERRAGTLEFLLTSSTKPLHLVLGKFLACLALVAIALLLTLPLPLTVAQLGPLDWGPVIGGYVATLALASAYIAIGLFVSARTDSQIVSLIITALICGFFYVIGSPTLTVLLGNTGGEFLRLLGSGSRFESITRGVIDLRDIYYYASIFGVFMVLNLYALESVRWSTEGRESKHRAWQVAAGLVIANLVAANFWLDHVGWTRADLTEGNIYSVSDETRGYLAQLNEPLLIRGYFSAETHPLLAPLVPRIRDLLAEYEVAGNGKVRVEFVDPVGNPELEGEANGRFNIRPVPFQTSSKYQASVTNSYFDILIKYGDEFETLGYQDLIEVKQSGEQGIDVELRNPEYDITRAIKKVLYSYRGGADVFASLPNKVYLDAYVSKESQLLDPLPKLKEGLAQIIEDYTAQSKGKFEGSIRDPEADGGKLAQELQQTRGLRPLAAGLLGQKKFWFHILLRSGDRVQAIELPRELDKASLEEAIKGELKRLRPGALKTIALVTPPPAAPQQQQIRGMPPPPPVPTYKLLGQKLRENSVVQESGLFDGRVPENADMLMLISPEKFNDQQLFAVDQFLMKGGTVAIASSAFKPIMTQGLKIEKVNSGLEEWLEHNGLKIEEKVVLDTQNAPFPVPIMRDLGGVQVRDIQMVPYPHFVDVRDDGLADGELPTAGLNHIMLSWVSPLVVDKEKASGRTVHRLIESSASSWTSDSLNVIPNYSKYPNSGYPLPEERGRQLLAASIEGKFTSFYAGKPSPVAELARQKAKDEKEAAEKAAAEAANDAANAQSRKPDTPATGDDQKKPDESATVSGVIETSPDSARIILIGSGSFMSDDILGLLASVEGTQTMAPVRFAENLVDWSLEDRGLLSIRARDGQFSRTLLPISETGRMLWEYLNYVLALAGLVIVYLVHRASSASAQNRYNDILSETEA